MKVISFINHKGGVGKTTLCYNLAVTLKRYKKKNARILVIDNDPQANLTLMFTDYDDLELKDTIYELYANDRNPKIHQHDYIDAVYNIFLTTEVQDKNDYMTILKMKTFLNDIKDKYDYVFIDNPPNLGALTSSAVMASDELIIAVEPDAWSVKGMVNIQRFVQQIKRMNNNLNILGIIINKVDRRYNEHKAIIKSLKKAYSETIFSKEIGQTAGIQKAKHRRVSLGEFAPSHREYKSFKIIVDEISERIENRNSESKD